MTREKKLNAYLVTLIETMIDEAADTLSKMSLRKTAITNNEKRAHAFAALFIAKMNYDAGQMSLSEEAPILDDALKNTRVYFSAKEDVGPYLLAFEPYGCEYDIKKISFAEYENYKDLLDMGLKLSPGEDEFIRKIAKESVEKVILNYCEKVKARIPFAAQNVMMIQSYREFLKDFQKTADIEKTDFLKVKKFEDFLAKKQEFVLSSTEISNSLKKNAFSQIFEKNKDSDLSLEFQKRKINMAKTTIFKLDPRKLSDKDFYDLYDNLFKTSIDERSGDQRINRSKINSIELKLTRDELLEEEGDNPRYKLYLLALDKANKIRVVQGIDIDLSEEGFTTLKTLVEIMNMQSPSLNIEIFHDFSVKDVMNTIYLSNYGNEQILTLKEVRSAFAAFASFLEADNISEVIADPTPSEKISNYWKNILKIEVFLVLN